jgi:hypothetical protein
MSDIKKVLEYVYAPMLGVKKNKEHEAGDTYTTILKCSECGDRARDCLNNGIDVLLNHRTCELICELCLDRVMYPEDPRNEPE